MFINSALNISESSKMILNEMLKDVPADTANISVEITKDGTRTIMAGVKVGIGSDNQWMIGVGAYHKQEVDGGSSKGAGVSVSW